MVWPMLAALALSASLDANVPFVPQTPDLCGGAAVAMVFRYWGDTRADVQPFAPLVDRNAGGIAETKLVDAVRARGWRATPFTGSVEVLRNQIAQQRPVVVLLHERGNRYHYVVVTGVDAAFVTVHDPSWGPSRAIESGEFEKRWSAARFWSLMILPTDEVRLRPDPTYRPNDAASASVVGSGFSRTSDDTSRVRLKADAPYCNRLLDDAIANVRERGLEHADVLLGRVRAECPASAGPLRELAGVRFAEHRWDEAVALAREAIARDQADSYAIDLLGSSLFMRDDPIGALRAWNQIGKPRLDTMTIEGLRHTRYESVAAAVGLRPNALVTDETFALATRRLHALPDRSSSRLTLRPSADGFATLDAVIAERSVVPHGLGSWAGLGIRAAIDREADVSVPGFSGEGDIWSASWRWWEHRPRVAFGVAVPRAARLRGVWRVDASWERETYRVGSSEGSTTFAESHTHGGFGVSDWLTSNLHYAISGGLDEWGTRKTASIGGSLERRLFDDRLSLGADVTTWMPLGDGRGFHAAGVRATAQSPMQARTWAYAASAGAERVTSDAPMGLWPGAGDGRARTPLLRAHPLLNDGIVDATVQSAFGRTLGHASLEGQRWFERPALLRLGAAAFVDAAAARRGVPGSAGSSNVDVGAGLRVRLPGADRVLRIDVAHGLSDHAHALTVGWLF